MSVRRAQREISSDEFSEWVAFYVLAAEAQDPDRAPDPDQLTAKIYGWAQRHNAAWAASQAKKS